MNFPFLPVPVLEALRAQGSVVHGPDVGMARFDPLPIVRLHAPPSPAFWVLFWIEYDDPDLAYGFLDSGAGPAELSYLRLSDLASLSALGNSDIVRDSCFQPIMRMSAYRRFTQAPGAGLRLIPEVSKPLPME